MGNYCITAANHSNKDNHCASQFKVWEYDVPKNTWMPFREGKSINFVNDLLAAGHTVLSAKLIENKMYTGAAIETELRIKKNDTNYKISDMPRF
ncbi:hypothetical protein GN109_23295 [Collimonas pratensis]|uniref:hypothetical protein n=1 Tax=Collimonas pratensis TaxID=279113 RepID=UPI00143CD859|nr:hypothetical protein [Collimonas pratensis]NKI72356.1 hypothetical protein [Collimonas pratensis]